MLTQLIQSISARTPNFPVDTSIGRVFNLVLCYCSLYHQLLLVELVLSLAITKTKRMTLSDAQSTYLLKNVLCTLKFFQYAQIPMLIY